MDETLETPEAEARTAIVTLSDGREVTLKRGKGRDMLEASRRSGQDGSRFQFELLALLASTDNAPLGFDDIMDMNLADVALLLATFRNADFLSAGRNKAAAAPESGDTKAK